MMKRFINRLIPAVSRTVIFVACGFVSGFVLSSAYESVYNRSLPYVHTLDAVDLSVISHSYNLPVAAQLKSDHLGQFGKPVTLKLPSDQRSLRLDITDPVYDTSSGGGTWLGRASSMHVLLPKPAASGNITTNILYCRASFRTVNATSLPKVGANIFVDTDKKWRYVYKVTTAQAFDTSYKFVPTEAQNGSRTKGKLIVFCNDLENNANDIIEADLIAVQGVEL